MASELSRGERNLVALYAERLGSRGAGIPVGSGPRRAAPAVHQFGRRPGHRARRSMVRRGGTVSALVATALVVGAQGASAATTHEVKPGETLAQIAAQYQTTVEDLASINNLADPNLIIAGSLLTVAPDSADAQVEMRTHEVKPGETLFAIAGKYGVTLESIVDANDLADPNMIVAGSSLKIPSLAPHATQPAAVAPPAGSPALHLVAPGETLGKIADKYGVSVESLVAANDISDPNHIKAGSLLQIPGAAPVNQNGTVVLRGMPTLRQSLPLSCESAALSIATAYWGNQVSEWVFIENMPSHPNPHHGFRGSMTGPFGGTTDYGVYAEPLVPLLNAYGYAGEVFYADGNADALKQQIDQGRPVIVWMTNMASVQPRTYEWYDGERFALVPQQHVVVVYGYDNEKVHVVDPGDGAYRTFDWDDFMRSWGYFDGMSLAVHPA